MNQPSINKIYAYFAALGLSFGFLICCLTVPGLSAAISARGNLNLLSYAAQLVLFCLLYFLFCLLFCRGGSKKSRGASAAVCTIAVLLTLAAAVFLLRMMKRERDIFGGVTDRYVWHKLPVWLVLLMLAGEYLFFLFCVRGGSIRLPGQALWILYGILTILIGYTFYTPGIFVRGASDRLHADAYFNSIYNVLHGCPYSDHATSIYGHYAILYRLPLRLLGGDYIDFILLNAVLGALCFLPMFAALHLTVKNNLLRVLGAIAMTFPILSMRGGYYWQLWPHRILFMSLMIFLAAVSVRLRFRRIICAAGYLLCALAILWNTESGLFCTVAWAGFQILRDLCDREKSLLRTAIEGICHLAAIVLCFLGAYGITILYNLACGGGVLSLRVFLFPLLTSSYMTELLRIDLTLFPSAWMPVLALFLLGVAWGISRMRFFRRETTELSRMVWLPCFSFFIGVLSLGQLSYYMNRATYHNLDICHLPAILLICILAERGMETVQQFRLKKRGDYTSAHIFQGAFTAVSLAILLTVSTGTFIQYGFNTDLKTQFHDYDGLRDFAAHVAANLPENTYAFGIGVPEIYSILRWDTGCYTLDFADISVYPPAADYVIEDIREKNIPAFLTGENTYKKLKNFSADHNRWLRRHYRLEQKFEYQGCVFRYYVQR